MFLETKASRRSISCRKLVYGVGINDVNYAVSYKVNNVNSICPFYIKWNSMLRRCYSAKFHEKQPTYIDCYVCKSWLVFSNFKIWMQQQNWKGKALDKDIIKPGNKMYSPETCAFVSRSLNSLIINSSSSRGDHPQGVCFFKESGKYMSTIRIKGTMIYLGLYQNALDASLKYKKARTEFILKEALNCCDNRVAKGLILHADILNKK